ncbi:MAG: permease [Anaerolineae bacterium]|nr:permease [Anaerolineae bacterium]
MPADPFSTLMLILLTAADTVGRLWPYVAGGIAAAALLSWAVGRRQVALPLGLPRPLAASLAVVAGAASPLPTAGVAPVVLQLRGRGLPPGPGLAFVLASLLMNPQLFVLTLGALGPRFALTQLAAVLAVSVLLGLVFDARRPAQWSAESGKHAAPSPAPIGRLAGHVAFYFLVGVLAGAAIQVLLPHLGALDWLAERGWLSTPLLGWLGAPLYTCGGSAVPLANSLGQAGFSQGTLLAFLLVGPALRSTSLASLGCLLPKRALIACLAGLALAAGLAGCGLDWLLRGV